MKKLLFLSTVLILGFTGVANAQLQEGNLMLGSDIGSGITNTGSNGLFGFNFGLNDGAGFNVGTKSENRLFCK